MRGLAVPMILMLVTVSSTVTVVLCMSMLNCLMVDQKLMVLEQLDNNIAELVLGLTSDTRNDQTFPKTPTNSTTERSSLLGAIISDNATEGVSTKIQDKDGILIDNGTDKNSGQVRRI